MEGEVGLQDVEVGQSGDQLGSGSIPEALLDRETADAMNDRKDTTLLEVQRIARAFGCDQGVKEPDRYREGVHSVREMSQISLLAADQIDQRCLGRSQTPRVASDGARIVKDSAVHMSGFVGQCHPAAEIGEIVGERLRPS